MIKKVIVAAASIISFGLVCSALATLADHGKVVMQSKTPLATNSIKVAKASEEQWVAKKQTPTIKNENAADITKVEKAKTLVAPKDAAAAKAKQTPASF